MGLRLRSVLIGRSCRVRDALSNRTTDEDGGEVELSSAIAGREASRIARAISRRGAVNSQDLDRKRLKTVAAAFAGLASASVAGSGTARRSDLV